MSDLLTHWAIFEDCRRLAQIDATVEPLFARLIHEERESARLGALTRGGRKWVPSILANARGTWPQAADPTRLGRKIAFALGGIAHFTADVTLKPLMNAVAQADWNTTHYLLQGQGPSADTRQDPAAIREVSAYYDIQVFREVYLSGHEEPFNCFLTAANHSEPGQVLEEFVRSLFQRALLSCHTLDPDRENVDAWLDALFARVQPLYIDINLYVRVFTEPDPAKLERYRVMTAFYRSADPIVRIARAVQRGEGISQEALDAALTDDANEGGYGRSLALGMQRLRDASAYWRGEIPEMMSLKQSVRWVPDTA